MGAKATYGNEYKDQKQFDQFFSTAFDRYDKNRDGKIDYKEYQPLINDMCKMIQNKYGNGPTLDKIRQAWMTLDKDKTGYLTRNEFSLEPKKKLKKFYLRLALNKLLAHKDMDMVNLDMVNLDMVNLDMVNLDMVNLDMVSKCMDIMVNSSNNMGIIIRAN